MSLARLACVLVVVLRFFSLACVVESWDEQKTAQAFHDAMLFQVALLLPPRASVCAHSSLLAAHLKGFRRRARLLEVSEQERGCWRFQNKSEGVGGFRTRARVLEVSEEQPGCWRFQKTSESAGGGLKQIHR